MIKVEVDDVDRVISKAIRQGLSQIRQDEDKQLNLLSEELASNLRLASPKSSGRSRHYANGWRKRIDKIAGYDVYVVYNKIKPRLTHILERGTMSRKTLKGYNRGSGPAIPHIRKETEKIFEKLKRR